MTRRGFGNLFPYSVYLSAFIAMFSFAVAAATIHAGETPTIMKIAGKADILKLGQWRSAAIGDSLEPGDEVRTDAGGEVILSAAEGAASIAAKSDTTIKYEGAADPESQPWKNSRLFQLQGMQPRADAASEQFSCPKGEVEANVQTGASLRIITPLVTASVRGTGFVVRASDDGSSFLRVLSGLVQAVNRAGMEQMVAEGMSFELSSQAFDAMLRNSGLLGAGQNWRDLSPDVLDAVYDEGTQAGSPSVNEASAQLSQLDQLLEDPNADPYSAEELLSEGGSFFSSLMAITPAVDWQTDDVTDRYRPAIDNALTNTINDKNYLLQNLTPVPPIPEPPVFTTALVSGSLVNPRYDFYSPAPIVKTPLEGTFGFAVDLQQGTISAASVSSTFELSVGDGVHESFNINLTSGTGMVTNSGSSVDFDVADFNGSIVIVHSGDSSSFTYNVDSGTNLTGSAASGFGNSGNPVTGGFVILGENTPYPPQGIVSGDISGSVTQLK